MEKDNIVPIERKPITSDLDAIFDALILKGTLEMEETIFPGFLLKVKPLDAAETLAAESAITFVDSARDIVFRARMVSVLARATISINSNPIELPNLDEKENDTRRRELHIKFMKLPPNRVEDCYSFYRRVQIKQDEIYSAPVIAEQVKNF